jgi:hypothetical protein
MKLRKRHGAAMMTALVGVMFVFTTGTGLLTLSMQGVRRGRFDVLRPRALALAEAGAEKAVYYLRTVAPDGSKDGSWRTESRTETQIDGEYTMTIRDGSGANYGRIIITSTGTAKDGPVAGTSGNSSAQGPLQARRTVRLGFTLEREEISIWNNVIFGGVGQAGKSINGNVRLRGSVTFLGDGEPFNDVNGNGVWNSGEAFTDSNGDGLYTAPLADTASAVELGGGADIGNNYDGMPSDLRNRIPSLATTVYRGETVESLRAKLRVKNGQVSLSGSSQVGYANQSGSPSLKETMDGVYVTDGFSGNQGSVYSDNGTSNGYNLGTMLRFPSVMEPVEKGGTTYPTYMAYLKTIGMTISGPVTFKPGETYGPFSDGRGNSLKIDDEGKIEVNGVVYVEGNVTFDKNGGKKEMTYTGRGTLVSTGNISIETSLIPVNTFPTQDAMGFVARRDLAVGVSSQLTVAGAFFAEQKITSSKQNELAGTFVSNYFATQNVPHMYQVPSLVQNLPPAMPGADRIYVKSVRVDSWREMAGG